MSISIQGIGVVGGFGCGTKALTSALVSGQSTPRDVSVKTPQGPLTMEVFCADTSGLEEFVAKKALRRVDHFSRMAILGSYLALKDAGRLEEDRGRMGIIIATGYGATRTTYAFLDSFIADGDNFASPTSFSNSVHNSAVANVSMLLNITGPGLTVSQFEMSVASALITARCWLEEGTVDNVLFGAVDEYCDVLGYCWHRYFREAATAQHGMEPFNFDLQSAIPGEGASFFLLSRDDGHASPYGCLKDVCLEMMDRRVERADEGAVYFIGADGHKECGVNYRLFLSEHSQVACYTPLYGSLPIGQAFDMAIAALAIKSGVAYPSMARNNKGTVADSTHGELPRHTGRICCVKISNRGEMGTIILGS